MRYSAAHLTHLAYLAHLTHLTHLMADGYQMEETKNVDKGSTFKAYLVARMPNWVTIRTWQY